MATGPTGAARRKAALDTPRESARKAGARQRRPVARRRRHTVAAGHAQAADPGLHAPWKLRRPSFLLALFPLLLVNKADPGRLELPQDRLRGGAGMVRIDIVDRPADGASNQVLNGVSIPHHGANIKGTRRLVMCLTAAVENREKSIAFSSGRTTVRAPSVALGAQCAHRPPRSAVERLCCRRLGAKEGPTAVPSAANPVLRFASRWSKISKTSRLRTKLARASSPQECMELWARAAHRLRRPTPKDLSFVRPLKQPDDLILGRLFRVGDPAGILHRIVCQGRKVLGLHDVEHSQVCGNANLFGEGSDCV